MNLLYAVMRNKCRWSFKPLLGPLLGPLRSTAVHCGPLWSTAVHCGPLWFTVVHCGPLWSTVVHCGPLWSTAVHCGPLRSTVVHCGPLWFTVVFLFGVTGNFFSNLDIWCCSVCFLESRLVRDQRVPEPDQSSPKWPSLSGHQPERKYLRDGFHQGLLLSCFCWFVLEELGIFFQYCIGCRCRVHWSECLTHWNGSFWWNSVVEWTRPGSIPSTSASTRNISVCPVTKGRCISSPWRIRFSTGEASKSNYFLVNYSNHSSHVFLHRTFFSTGSCVFGTTLVFTPSLESSLRTLRSQKWPKWKVGWQIQGVRLHPVPLFFIFFIFSHLWKGPIDRKYFFWLVLRSTNRRSVLKWKKPLIFRTVADCSFFPLFRFTSDLMTVDCKGNGKSTSYRLALSKVEKKWRKRGTKWNWTLGSVTQLFIAVTSVTVTHVLNS